MNHVLDRNLEALLRQAYHPVRPRAEFRQALRTEWHSRVERRIRGGPFLEPPSVPPPRRWRPAVAIAAAVLIAVPLITLLALEFVRDGRSGPIRDAQSALESDAVAEVSGTDGDAQGTSDVGPEVADRRPLEAADRAIRDPGTTGLETPLQAATGVLVGRVVDAENGRPIPHFVLWRRLERRMPETATPVRFEVEDEQGNFRLESVTPERYALFVEAPGYAVWKVGGAQVEGGLESRYEVGLVRGSAVHGHVLDAVTGAPLAGARVFAEFDLPQQLLDFQGRDLARPPAASTLTDANGAYTLAHLSPGQHQLRVTHPEHATGWSPSFELPQAELESPLELAHVMLDSGGRLAGRVERPDGTPWEGVRVVTILVAMERPQPVMAYAAATTDAEGRYAVGRLPEGYYVAMHQGDSTGALHTASNLRQTSVRRGVTTVLDFVPHVGGSELGGVLMDANEQPLIGYTVYLNPDPLGAAFQNWIATPVRAAGRYRFEGVAQGTYDLYVAESPDDMIWMRRLDVAGDGDLNVDLVMPVGSVSGVVRRADGSNTNALVMLMRWDEEHVSWAFHGKVDTSLEGDYAFSGLGPGRYRLSVLGLTPSAGSANPAAFDLLEEAERQDIALVAGGSLSLEVRNEAGEPVPGARVCLLDESGLEFAYHAEGTTDASGHQRVASLAEGTWTVIITREGMQDSSDSVQVLVGEESTLRVTLRRTSGR